MLQPLAFVCLENLTLYSVCRSWERARKLKRRVCSSCEGLGAGGGFGTEERKRPLETSPRGFFSNFHIPRSPPIRGGEGERVPGGMPDPAAPGVAAPGRAVAGRRRRFPPAAWAAGQEREGTPFVCVPPSSSPPGDERGGERAPGTATRGTAGSRRGSRRPQGTPPGRNTGRLWGLRLSPFPAGRSGFSRLFYTVTLPSRRTASRVISSSCLVRG